MPGIPPPELPAGIDAKTGDYLRRFRTWVTTELERKPNGDEAIHTLLFTPQAVKPTGGPPGAPTVGPIFQLSVDSSGNVVTTQIPLGGGKP